MLILEQPLLSSVGKKYGKSPAQVAFRWALQKNITINPRTYKPDHMKVSRPGSKSWGRRPVLASHPHHATFLPSLFPGKF